MLAASGLPQGKRGRIDVATDLTVPGFPGVDVPGDAPTSSTPKADTCRSRPVSGPPATSRQTSRTGHASRFRYLDKGIRATIGWGGRGSRGRHHPPPAAGPTGFRGVAGAARGAALRHPRADRGGALMGVGLLHPQQATDRRWPAGRVRRQPRRHCCTRPRWHSPGLRPSSGTYPEMPASRLFSSQRGSYPTAAVAL